MDCVGESIEVHPAPHTDGSRDVARLAGPAATVTLQAFPDVALALGEIFGQPPPPRRCAVSHSAAGGRFGSRGRRL